ncbi:BTB/POZ domain-containing protein 3-like [Sitodiplosis mosellana]|uniref:BTB/POZ domain-containing protein 3-like n=1 Tax=Sitodiplosis mosellana TaxID=263140 RepID=UPI0024450F90|nr:BTB/POZ domain-containing protein 3-like [Sitodiplosis mosellana]
MSTSNGKTSLIRDNKVVNETMNVLYSQKNETGDVTFVVESESIRAHRNILAAISPKYKAQFYGAHADKGEIHVNDVSAAAFNEFLQFFYLNRVDLNTKNIEGVLNLAKQSLVDAFVTECIDFLMEVVNVDNLCWAYRLAISYDIKKLKDHCEPQISANTKKVFASEDFINCDHDLLIHILKLDTMDCKETEVFDACIAWAKSIVRQEDMDSGDMEHLHATLFDAITHIRFSSMTAEEFAEIHSKYKGFFTADESCEIFYMIGKLKGYKSQRFNQTPRNQTKKPLHNDQVKTAPVQQGHLQAQSKNSAPIMTNQSVNIPFVREQIAMTRRRLLDLQ